MELNNALFFVHTRLGLVGYFCAGKLNKLVIVDPFDIITKFLNKKSVRHHGDTNDIVKWNSIINISQRY